MARRGTPFQGVLYAGLMIADGAPRLVEYNVRFGDPEAQVLAMRLGAQLLDACLACATGELAEARVNFADDQRMTVVMAARGLSRRLRPRRADRRSPRADDPRVKVFHAGTRRGRRAARLGRRPRAQRHRPRRDASPRRATSPTPRSTRVDWPGGFYRRDIGWRALSD